LQIISFLFHFISQYFCNSKVPVAVSVKANTERRNWTELAAFQIRPSLQFRHVVK